MLVFDGVCVMCFLVFVLLLFVEYFDVVWFGMFDDVYGLGCVVVFVSVLFVYCDVVFVVMVDYYGGDLV